MTLEMDHYKKAIENIKSTKLPYYENNTNEDKMYLFTLLPLNLPRHSFTLLPGKYKSFILLPGKYKSFTLLPEKTKSFTLLPEK